MTMQNLMEVARLTGIIQRLLREHGEEHTADIVARALSAASKYYHANLPKTQRRIVAAGAESRATAASESK
jgi:hypothetical protein